MISIKIKRSSGNCPNSGVCGFTLIELLVVIAIIAVLLAIIAPCIRKAKSNTKRVICQNNLIQLYKGWQVYLLDNDDLFYKGKNANLKYGGWKGEKGWLPRPLNTYLDLPSAMNSPQGAEVYLCPGDKGGVPGYNFHEKAFMHVGTSYQANFLLIGYWQIEVPDNEYKTLHEEINKVIPNPNIKNTDIDNPSLVILLGDFCWLNRLLSGDREVKDWHDKKNHDNIVFCDGHVELIQVHKGIYKNDDYTILPRKSLYKEAYRAQETKPVDED